LCKNRDDWWFSYRLTIEVFAVKIPDDGLESASSACIFTGAEPHKKEGALRLIVMTEGNGNHFL